MSKILDNDDERMFSLAQELDRVSNRLTSNMTDIEKALQNVMRRCDDARITEFNAEFKATNVLLKDFGEYLGRTSLRLRDKAGRIERARKH